MLLLPDGREQEIARHGSPSLLEWKRLLGIRTGSRIQALVAELMSIRPESLRVEALRMLRPHILVITNVRRDHLAQMGQTRQHIARGFAACVPKKACVIVPDGEFAMLFERRAEEAGSRVIKVSSASLLGLEEEWGVREFPENIRLALAVADVLEVGRETALRGMRRARPDFGHLQVWRADLGYPLLSWYLVSAFAANDPDSTRMILSRFHAKGFLQERRVVGLLNLRADRGDRTRQWLESLEAGEFPEFHELVFVGDQALLAQKRLRRRAEGTAVLFFKNKSPDQIMAALAAEGDQETVLFGMGNMGGMGRKLVEYWQRIGEPYGL